MARTDLNDSLRGKASYLIAFLAIWSGYFGLIAFFNLTSKYGNFSWAISYQFLFIALSSSPILILPAPLPVTNTRSTNSPYVLASIWISLALAVLGIVSLFVDKMTNGVDYTAGICMARYQMNRIAAARDGGISSLYSVFGNLFATSFFVSVAVAMVNNVSRRVYYATFSIAFACLMALAMIASSRTPILLFGAFFLALICLRLLLRRPIRIRKADIVFGALLLACALLFVGSVFGCRATYSNMTMTEYKTNFAPYLGVEESDTAPQVLSDNVSGIVGMTALYLIHSAYTFAGIISMPPETARIMFAYPMDLLARIGIVEPPNGAWSLAGRFASVPGGLYHDFGFFGMCFGAVLMGFLVWLSMLFLKVRPGSTILLGVASMMFTIMFLSPIHFAAEFASFPFICFSFVVTAGLATGASRLFSRGTGSN